MNKYTAWAKYPLLIALGTPSTTAMESRMLQTSHHITANAVTRQKAALEPIGPLPWPLQLTLTPQCHVVRLMHTFITKSKQTVQYFAHSGKITLAVPIFLN